MEPVNQEKIDNSSFMTVFNQQDRDLLEKRADGFRAILDVLERSNERRYFRLLETGTIGIGQFGISGP
jgi:hypothetical protein